MAARPEILKQRREIAEHPFGSIKQWMNQGTFLLRGLEKVRAEFSLTAGLQFHPRGEHCGRREPPQSGVKEGGRLPPVTSRPRGAGDRSCGTSQMATALRDLIPSNANSPERFHTVWSVYDLRTTEKTLFMATTRPFAEPTTSCG